MRIKEADDKTKRITLLESLQASPMLDASQKKWLDKELWAVKEGVRGERDAAHYLDNHFASSENSALIHDLRLEVDGEVAQIDHLLISRGFIFYLLETKQYNGDLHINELGEFSVSYGGRKPWGIASPLEQSRRHQNVLVKLLSQLGISGRTQKEPEFWHVILVNPKSQIHRPDKKAFDTSNVIKADQFASWREKRVNEDLSIMKTLTLFTNLRGADTVKEWAELICAQHKPLNLLSLPDFMKPKPVVVPEVRKKTPIGEVCAECSKAISAAEVAYCKSKASLFGSRLLCKAHQAGARKSAEAVQASVAPVVQAASVQQVTADDMEALKRKLICCTCKAKISFPEGKFCWSQEARFKGFQYCREHQADFR